MGNPTCACVRGRHHTGDAVMSRHQSVGREQVHDGSESLGVVVWSKVAESPPSLIIQHSLQKER